MKKILTLIIFLVSFKSVFSEEIKVNSIYSIVSGSIVFQVIANPEKSAYWGIRESDVDPLYLKISDGKSSQFYHDSCGILYGVIMESISMKPRYKKIKFGMNDEFSLTVKTENILISAKDLEIVMSWEQAELLVSAMERHWREK